MMEMMQIQQNMNTTRNIPQERRCYTVEELMEILTDCCPDIDFEAVYSLIHRKVFPAIRINSVGYRIPKESFHAWLYQQH